MKIKPKTMIGVASDPTQLNYIGWVTYIGIYDMNEIKI